MYCHQKFGNAGGPGNPHARHCARMLTMFRNTIDDDNMVALVRILYDRACTGDMGAIKLILSYKIGKPGTAPNPDGLEHDEWNRFAETAVQHQEVHDLLTSLPSNVANDLVRGTWPIRAATFAEGLGRQLQPEGGLPGGGQATEAAEGTLANAPGEPPADEACEASAPCSSVTHPTLHSANAAPIANGKNRRASKKKPARNQVAGEPTAPIANGKSARSQTAKQKKHRPWVDAIARQMNL
jgi:hypothetical protein